MVGFEGMFATLLQLTLISMRGADSKCLPAGEGEQAAPKQLPPAATPLPPLKVMVLQAPRHGQTQMECRN